MNLFCRRHLTMRQAPVLYVFFWFISIWNTYTINLSFCVAYNSLFSKLSLSDLTPRALVTFFNVIFPSILLISSSDSDGISLSSLFFSYFFLSFFNKSLRKYASFNADFFFIAYAFSLVCYTIVHTLANKMSFFFSSFSKLQRYFHIFSPSDIHLALEHSSTP